MFPHLQEISINIITQKKGYLNVILIALSEIQFGHQGGGTSEKQHFRGFSRRILKNISKQLFFPLYLDLVSRQVKVTQQLHYFVYFKWIIRNFTLGTPNVLQFCNDPHNVVSITYSS